MTQGDMHNVTVLVKEKFAMQTSIRRNAALRLATLRFDRTETFQVLSEDTPYSPYLRHWFAQKAAQHRSLLLNIHAASRLVPIPIRVGR